MDGQKFDDLVKTLASGATRRRVLRSLAGGIAALATLARVPAPTGAQDDRDTRACVELCRSLFEGRGVGQCISAGARGEGPCSKLIIVAASPARVWAALTDPKAIAALGLANNFAPQVGHRFRLQTTPRGGFDGVMEAEVVEILPERRLSFTWRGGPLKEPTTVTIRLDPDGTGTRLWVGHDAPDQKPCQAAALLLGRNWQRTMLGEALPRHLR